MEFSYQCLKCGSENTERVMAEVWTFKADDGGDSPDLEQRTYRFKCAHCGAENQAEFTVSRDS